MSANRPDFLVWDPIPDRSTKPNRIDMMRVHTAVTTADDIYGPQRGPGGTYAHTYNPSKGRMRLHQELDRKAYAALDGNGRGVDVENEDAGPRGGEVAFTNSQIENMARLFAHLVNHYGTPNRIATPDDVRGLAWHRLGCRGNYGRYDRNNMLTWSAAQTGQNWTTVYGKTCPTNPRIRQIPEIYARAQKYITGASLPAAGGGKSVPIPTQEDTLSKQDVTELKQYLHALLIGGYRSDGTNFPGMSKVDIENQRRINVLTEMVAQIAKKTGTTIDYAAIERAAERGVSEALKALEADVTLTVKGA